MGFDNRLGFTCESRMIHQNIMNRLFRYGDIINILNNIGIQSKLSKKIMRTRVLISSVIIIPPLDKHHCFISYSRKKAHPHFLRTFLEPEANNTISLATFTCATYTLVYEIERLPSII